MPEIRIKKLQNKKSKHIFMLAFFIRLINLDAFELVAAAHYQ